MDELLPREIKGPEAKLLGISPGWYVAKVNGTLTTEPFVSSEECEKEIKKIVARAAERAKASRIDPPEV